MRLRTNGGSSDCKRLFQEFGGTAEAVAAAAENSLARLMNVPQ